jgi:ABC-type bacteriocin/lantibiotic exporter with double-glycine peptidase domain
MKTARVILGALAWTAFLGFLGWRAWERWGPVPERAVSPTMEVRQWSVTTCGPAAVATLLNVYGRPWSREQLEQECRVTPAGTSLYDLREACRRRGLRAEGLQATHARGLLRVPRPFIAYLRPRNAANAVWKEQIEALPAVHPSSTHFPPPASGHFVVVERLRKGRLDVFDPTSGSRQSWRLEELYRRGSGWVLSISPPG